MELQAADNDRLTVYGQPRFRVRSGHAASVPAPRFPSKIVQSYVILGGSPVNRQHL